MTDFEYCGEDPRTMADELTAAEMVERVEEEIEEEVEG